MVTQRWRSGRTRTTRNRVTWEHVRGFKSLSLRQSRREAFASRRDFYARGMGRGEACSLCRAQSERLQPQTAFCGVDYFYSYVIMVVW